MAGQDADLNLDLGGSAKKSKAKLFLIIGIALVVLLGGGGAAWYFLKGKSDKPANEASKEEESAHAEGEGPAQFVQLKDKFVVNIAGDKRDRVAQIGITFMSHSHDAPKAIEDNMPLIRSTLLELFSVQKSEQLMTREGKEKLREDALKRIEAVLKEAKSEVKIDKVLFTDIVMQ